MNIFPFGPGGREYKSTLWVYLYVHNVAEVQITRASIQRQHDGFEYVWRTYIVYTYLFFLSWDVVNAAGHIVKIMDWEN